ncbi:hypothetical protein [Faecalibacillus intestinalis]|uniref:hypothetical protein n=1 Tax=Faecalibacillus intestinalis TaxID=1982626 RepID=UPI003FF106E6
MDRCIITPTYVNHFKYIRKYLESFLKYVNDKENVTLIFTISNNEKDKFNEVISDFKNKCDIKVLIFEDILRYYNVPYTNEELLFKYKKFSYQTLKKFYTMLYCNYKQMLVLDSETEFITETNIKNLFIDYFSNPFITFCDNTKLPYIGDFKKGVIYNCKLILNMSNDYWFLENFVWFYDKDILNDLFANYGTPIEIVDKIYKNTKYQYLEPGCFEICLYQSYLYMNKDKYNYRVLDSTELLKIYLKKDYTKYINDYLNLLHGEFGLLEMSMVLLKNHNYMLLAQLFKDNNISVMRCDYSNFENYYLQKKFLNFYSPKILAASQNHCFGINDKIYYKFKMFSLYNNKYAHFIYHDLNFILEPFKFLFYRFRALLYIFKNLFLWFVEIVKNLKVFYG